MNYRFLPERLPFILFRPEKAWKKIASENVNVKELRNNYLFPLVFLAALFTFLGSLLVINANLPVTYSVFEFFKSLLLLLIVIYASAATLKEITYALDLGRSFAISFRIIVYSLTPVFICFMASHLFDSLVFVNILSVYSLFLFWTGSEQLLNPPDHKKVPMLIAVTAVVVFYYIAASVILNKLTDKIFYAFFD